MSEHDTIFDKIIAGKIPADIVYQDEWVIAFRDIAPKAPTHVLVIPKRRVARFAQLRERDAAEVGEFFKRVSSVAEKLGLEKNGYRVVINNGRDGQQTVEYMHAHIFGGREMFWPPG